MKKLLFAGLMVVAFFAVHSPSAMAADSPDKPITVKFTGEKAKLPPATFDHSAHDGFECQDCHHNMAESKDMQCGNCHTVVPSADMKLSKQECKDCHKLVVSREVGCVDCHKDIGKDHKRSPAKNCFDCHDAVKDKVACEECHNKPRPQSYSNAFHAMGSTRSCLGCHSDMGAGPTECAACHKES